MNAPPRRPHGYRPDVDGLRAVAVLAVMLGHLDVPGFSGGYVGVDVFFVISGYLITRNLLRARQAGRWSLRDFYGRRVRRLFPALFLVLVVSLGIAFLLLSPGAFSALAESVRYTSVLAPNVFFWKHAGYFAPLAELQPTLHLWSLGIEEQFYLLWPLGLLALLRLPRALGATVLVAVAALVTGSGERWLEVDPNASFYLLPFRGTGLAMGALLAFTQGDRTRPPALADALLGIALGAVAVAVVRFDRFTPYPGLHALLPTFGAVLAIHAGEAQTTGRLLRNRPMVAIGLASYSLYLVHWPILSFYRYWALRPLDVPERIAVAALSLACAAAMYRWVEQPFRAGPHVRLTAAGFAAACFASTVVLVFAAATIVTDAGLPWRTADRAWKAPPEPAPCRPARRHPGCFLGIRKPVTEDVLLIGDSHARALSTGLDWVAKRHGLKVRRWIQLGCPPLFDVEITAPGWSDVMVNACARARRAWRRYVEDRRPSAVVLAGRWTTMTETGDHGLAPERRKWLAMHGGNGDGDRLRGPALFADVLARTVATIVAQGSKVVVLGQVPEPGVPLDACRNVPVYLSSPARLARRCPLVSYDQSMARVAFSNAAVLRLADDHVLPLLATDAFCDAATRMCRFFHDGCPLYDGLQHLSTAGSLALAAHVEPTLVAFLRGQRGRRARQRPNS